MGSEAVAIVGMAGRFPGSPTLPRFWENLRDGVECISQFSEKDLIAEGLDPGLLGMPGYVNAAGVVEEADLFDANFFGFSPREAEILDPQQRIFLECAWHALEDAAFDVSRGSERVGVFGGSSRSTYLQNLLANPDLMQTVGEFDVILANEKDHVATRVSYKLDLDGPSVSVGTTCSTSLVALCIACDYLANDECDVALAGGVSVVVPRRAGYMYREGGVVSSDGHCRAFDADASGFVGGSGVGIVVLKRLSDALRQGDNIRAVVRGWAMNNDGAAKVGYTAPSVQGQSAVITAALKRGNIHPETIGYVEAHGTGTQIGDPIEIAALTDAFGSQTEKKQFCAIGSVKTNIGHLDPAAGVAGVIKTVLALEHGLLPPSLHFRTPNPLIDFANSPFYVNAKLTEWRDGPLPRRAGVSSYGIGGTNSHVVLESPPTRTRNGSRRARSHLLVQSAKTLDALDAASAELASYLRAHPDVELGDVAYTLQVGRQALKHRRITVIQEPGVAADADHSQELTRGSLSGVYEGDVPSVVFMFPGQGSQYPNMAKGLYEREPSFQATIDELSRELSAHVDFDLRDLLCRADHAPADAGGRLAQTAVTQPALFVTEYALGKLWMEWGVLPSAMIGHSVGEYVAACLSGVFSWQDGLKLIALRGRLMQQTAAGAMLAVPLPERQVIEALKDGLSLAAVNAPTQCVVAGPEEAISDLEQTLSDRVSCVRLRTSRAFHSALMEPIIEDFEELMRDIALHPPAIPYISNLTGTWVTNAQATDPEYWSGHLRRPVRFGAGVAELLKDNKVFLEVGPGRTLSALVRQSSENGTSRPATLPSLPEARGRQSAHGAMLSSLGDLWLRGVDVDWPALHRPHDTRRISLPAYPFQRQRYWVDRRPPGGGGALGAAPIEKRPDISSWLYEPVWELARKNEPASARGRLGRHASWLVFCDGDGVGEQLVRLLADAGTQVVSVFMGDHFSRLAPDVYQVRPANHPDHDRLIEELRSRGIQSEVVVHLWSITRPGGKPKVAELLDRGFFSILALAQARKRQGLGEGIEMNFISSNMQPVLDGDTIHPAKATLLGPTRVIPQEHPSISCRSIDVDTLVDNASVVLDELVYELSSPPEEPVVAYRRGQRWLQSFRNLQLDEASISPVVLRKHGVYLVTGGLGGIGLALAEYLAVTFRARLVLLGRSPFPPRSKWRAWIETHDESEPVARAIRSIRRIESLGGRVLALRCDVTSPRQVERALERTSVVFGSVNGIIHSAGVAGGGVLQSRDPLTAAAVLAPKVAGTVVLEAATRRHRPDFMLLCSSLAGTLGGIGLVDYGAANAFQDAFAHASRRGPRSRTRVVAVDWDNWAEVGMAVKADLPPALRALRDESMHNAILPREGMEACARILWSGLPQVLVSPVDIQPRFRNPVHEERAIAAVASAPIRSTTKYPRPPLDTPFVPPEGEIEQLIADVWREQLGLEEVGRMDNFFELGGHSLMAVQVMARLRETFLVELPGAKLFEAPTVAELRSLIEESADIQELASLLQELDQLPAEDDSGASGMVGGR
jgi:acyl transferase domain-containing protein/acyl carrier protein